MKIRKIFLFTLLLVLVITSLSCEAKDTDIKEVAMSKEINDDLSILSDEFKDLSTLNEWKSVSKVENLPNRLEKIDLNLTKPDMLYMIPSSGAWWKGYHGAFLFKEVEGDFVVTARIRVTGKESSIPKNPWTLAGLMARVPNKESASQSWNQENWVYLMAGRGPKSWLVTDFKSTTNSENEWNTRKISDEWIELKLIRIDSLFIGMYRQDDKDWIIQGRWTREDMPSKLQVGINATPDWEVSKKFSFEEYNSEAIKQSYSDLIVQYDYVRFNRPQIKEELKNKLKDKRYKEISDEELLGLF